MKRIFTIIFGRRVIDIEVSKDGRVLGGIETKTGGSRYKPSQRAKDAWLGLNGYIVNVVRKQGSQNGYKNKVSNVTQ